MRLELFIRGRTGRHARVVEKPDPAEVVAHREEVPGARPGHRVDIRALDPRRLSIRTVLSAAEDAHDLEPQRRGPLVPRGVTKVPNRLPAARYREVQNLVPAAGGPNRRRVV